MFFPPIIGNAVGTLARAHELGVSFKVALCGSGTGTTARAVGKFAWEVAEEVVVEQVVSSVALALGAPPGLAEQIGEQMGGLDIIKNVLAIHEQKSEMKKETAESRAQRAHVVSTQPLSRTALQGSATQLVEALHAKLQVDRASSPSSQLLDIALTRLHHAETGGKITDIVRNTLANGLLEIRWVKDGRHFTLTDFPDPHVETRAIVEFVDAQLTSKVVDGTMTSANDLLDLQAINDYFGLAEAGRYYYLQLADSKTGASLTYTRRFWQDAHGKSQGVLEVQRVDADGEVETDYIELEETESGQWNVPPWWHGRGLDAIQQQLGGYDSIQVVDPDQPTGQAARQVDIPQSKEQRHKLQERLRSLGLTISNTLDQFLEEWNLAGSLDRQNIALQDRIGKFEENTMKLLEDEGKTPVEKIRHLRTEAKRLFRIEKGNNLAFARISIDGVVDRILYAVNSRETAASGGGGFLNPNFLVDPTTNTKIDAGLATKENNLAFATFQCGVKRNFDSEVQLLEAIRAVIEKIASTPAGLAQL